MSKQIEMMDDVTEKLNQIRAIGVLLQGVEDHYIPKHTLAPTGQLIRSLVDEVEDILRFPGIEDVRALESGIPHEAEV